MKGVALSMVFLLLTSGVAAQETAVSDSVAGSTRARPALLPVPILFYMPETGWGYGASLLYTFRERPAERRSRPSTETFAGIYTEKRQFLLQLSGEWYLSGDRFKVEHNLAVERFPAYLYGLGSFSGDDTKEAFTLQHTTVDGTVNRRVVEALSAGLVVHWERVRIIERAAGGLLASGAVPGWDGGTVSAFGAQALWDTRDNVFAASTGSFHALSAIFAAPALGSDFRFSKLKVDLRHYSSFGSAQSLALQALGVFVNGTAPFRELGRLGGAWTLRGYYDGRYRDNAMVALQGELRTAVAGRFGAVAFVGTGAVAHDPSALELRGVHTAAGIGVRFAFDPEERLNVRMDVGWGTRSSGVYFVAAEAF